MENKPGNLTVHPVTAERWPDMESLFGEKGAYAGCWCMFWRLKRSDLSKLDSQGKKAAMRRLVLDNQVPGLLAYSDGQPVGWVSLGPRERFAALEASRILKRVDGQPVWSIVCFFIARPARRQGVMRALIEAALAYARGQGARIVEAYPLDLQAPALVGAKLNRCTGYMGIASAFRKAGFRDVERASDTQVIMRLDLPGDGQTWRPAGKSR